MTPLEGAGTSTHSAGDEKNPAAASAFILERHEAKHQTPPAPKFIRFFSHLCKGPLQIGVLQLLSSRGQCRH